VIKVGRTADGGPVSQRYVQGQSDGGGGGGAIGRGCGRGLRDGGQKDGGTGRWRQRGRRGQGQERTLERWQRGWQGGQEAKGSRLTTRLRKSHLQADRFVEVGSGQRDHALRIGELLEVLQRAGVGRSYGFKYSRVNQIKGRR